MPRGDRTDMPGEETGNLHSHEVFQHFCDYNGSTLPSWIMPVMYGKFLPPCMHLEKMRGLRNPMDVPVVDYEILAAISYFMRNPNNWTEERNHVHPWERPNNSPSL
eukprot:6139166-Amphidinium_carterae.1